MPPHQEQLGSHDATAGHGGHLQVVFFVMVIFCCETLLLVRLALRQRSVWAHAEHAAADPDGMFERMNQSLSPTRQRQRQTQSQRQRQGGGQSRGGVDGQDQAPSSSRRAGRCRQMLTQCGRVLQLRHVHIDTVVFNALRHRFISPSGHTGGAGNLPAVFDFGVRAVLWQSVPRSRVHLGEPLTPDGTVCVVMG